MYMAFMRSQDAEGNLVESEIPLWIRFDEVNRELIIMPHAKSEIGTHYLVLMAMETTEGEESLTFETTIEITVKSNNYPAFLETIEVQ